MTTVEDRGNLRVIRKLRTFLVVISSRLGAVNSASTRESFQCSMSPVISSHAYLW